MRIRPLNPMEESFCMMNEVHPLSSVIVLHITDPALTFLKVKEAVAGWEKRRPFLRYAIIRDGLASFFTEEASARAVPVFQAEREDGTSYIRYVEKALNTKIDIADPLVHVIYVSSTQQDQAEILLAFHHSLVDSTILRILLDEMLHLLGGTGLKSEPPSGEWGEPHQEKQTRRRRSGSLIQDLRFGGAQMIDEWRYRRKGRSHPLAATSENAALSIRFSLQESRAILLFCGRNGISVNSYLGAALLLATIRHKYHDRTDGLFRAIAFADVRPFMTPVPERDAFGCFIAMLRYSISVPKGDNLLRVAKALHEAVVLSGRKGDLQRFFRMSKMVTRVMLKTRSSRMATSALSFIGRLDLAQQYGHLQLRDVSAFITNNRLGPEFSGFGKIFFGRIGLDCTYLPAETNPETASAILADVRQMTIKPIPFPIP